MKKINQILIPILLIINNLQAQTPEVEIWGIQGEGIFSPYLNQVVKTAENVVTAVGDDFFYIQTPFYRSDNNSSTSDGIRINTNNSPTVEVGNMVTITGTVRESFLRTQFSEDDPLSIQLDSSLVALPPPSILTENFPSPDSVSVPDLEKVEGMLVQLNNVQFTAGELNNTYADGLNQSSENRIIEDCNESRSRRSIDEGRG